MKFLLSLITFFIVSLSFGQEMLSPLLTNSKLFSKQSAERNIDDQYIYAIDTVHLPFKDDFSKDLFKKYNAQPTDSNVTDTLYYALLIGGVPVADSISYMEDTVYRLEITKITVDSVTIDSIPQPSTAITHCDLSAYPVQCVMKNVWEPILVIDSLHTGVNPDTFDLFPPDLVQDSAQVYFVSATDTNSRWVDNFAYINTSYAINPPTIGVATFDGLNENGYPYDFTTAFTYGEADYLTSKPIFLGTDETNFPYGIADSLYLSFYYQAKGLGNEPEVEDSLVLEFWSPVDMTWTSVWNTEGQPLDSNFKQVMIPIKENKYFANGFQFRFKNYASLSGSFDHWHIDYVYLEESRFIGDTNRDDVAFTEPINTLLSDYTAMPWRHYKWDVDNFTAELITTDQKNLSNVGKLVSGNEMEIYYQGTLDTTVINPNTPSVNANTSFTTDFDLLADNFVFDTTVNDTCAVFEIKVRHTTTPDRCRSNDTLIFNQVFTDYYAYDDGTAEAAYGVAGLGGVNPKIASEFDLIQPDTLKSLYIHFSPSANDRSSTPIIISVWEVGSGGRPGDLIYENISFSNPVYNIGVNGFHEYSFDEKVSLPAGKYFVGWSQTTADIINVGYDLNRNSNLRTYANYTGVWQQSGLDGTLMIRPAFVNEKDNLVGINEQLSEDNVSVYPNPTQDLIYIVTEDDFDVTNYQLIDINGRIIDQNVLTGRELNLSSLENGVYFLQLSNNQGNTITKRVIKN